MKPGLAHALLALALQGVIALPVALLLRIDAVALLLRGVVLAMVLGGAVAFGFYLGRERRQSEEAWGSNRIPPWLWRPRAFRDMGWPLLAVVLAVVATLLARAR